MGADNETSVLGVGGDSEILPKRGVFSKKGLERGGVGVPERDNVRLTGLEMKVGGESDVAEGERDRWG